MLSRMLFGARISLAVGLFAVIMEVLIGSTLGAVAGYYGGWVDYVLMRLTDVFLSIPLLPLLLVLTAIVAASSSKAALNFGVIVVIIGRLSWMPRRASRARLVPEPARARVCRGGPGRRATTTDGSSSAICFPTPSPRSSSRRPSTSPASSSLESVLSFLGFGIQPPTASWGNMLANAQIQSLKRAWWAAVFPGLCILDYRAGHQLYRRRPARCA